MVETKDTHKSAAIARQAILKYLKNTGRTMTKVLDFWVGVWDPDLREQYRTVYIESPKFARLPPTTPDCEETYSLRASVINRDTDEHHDKDDWGGLTSLVHLRMFKGHMYLPQLELRSEREERGSNPRSTAINEAAAQAPEPLDIEEPPIDSIEQSAKRKVDDQDHECESETRNKRSKRPRDGVTQGTTGTPGLSFPKPHRRSPRTSSSR